MSQSLTIKIGINIHSHKIQKAFWMTAYNMRKGCNLISNDIFNGLPYLENALHFYGSHKSPLSKKFWSNKLYHLVRPKTKLKSQETTDCFTIVISKYKIVKQQMKQHKIRYYNKHTGKYYYPTKLTQLKKPVKFHRPWVYMSRGRSWSFTHNKAGHPVLSLGTIDKRIKLPYKIPPYFKKYVKSTTQFGALQLFYAYPSKHYKHGRWSAHLTCTVPTRKLEHKDILYLVSSDRGLDNIIWTYDNHHKTFHISGKNILRRRMHYKHLRTQLQKKHSHSAHRKIKYISHKENRWRQNVNYNILKALYKIYPTRTMFGLEQLKNIRKALKQVPRYRRYTQVSWAGYDLENKWKWKAKLHHSRVVNLDAYNTSNRDPLTGKIAKSHRHHNNHLYISFKRHKNGKPHKYNDDFVGAVNIYDLLYMLYKGVEHPTFKYRPRGNK